MALMIGLSDDIQKKANAEHLILDLISNKQRLVYYGKVYAETINMQTLSQLAHESIPRWRFSDKNP